MRRLSSIALTEVPRYRLSPEQVVALTDADSPAYLLGFFRFALRARSAARRARCDCP